MYHFKAALQKMHVYIAI